VSWSLHSQNRGFKLYRFLIIIEKGTENYGAYAPDLPGCVAVGDTPEEVEKNMHEAIKMHLQGMIEDNEPIPTPHTTARYLEVLISHTATP
jgi:predicted RNase H-like HicB family nuclease